MPIDSEDRLKGCIDRIFIKVAINGEISILVNTYSVPGIRGAKLWCGICSSV